MTFKGHVENGTIVLDEPAVLPEGAPVRIELAVELPSDCKGATDGNDPVSDRFPLRGLAYHYDAPLDPAVVEGEWTASS